MRESSDSFSGGMFIADKKWNAGYIHVVYIHVLCQTKWRRNTDYIHVYGISLRCVRESSDLLCEDTFVPDKKWNVAHYQYPCTFNAIRIGTLNP